MSTNQPTLKLNKVKTQFNGQTVYVDIYEQGRDGSKSPKHWYYKYKGRWISQLEQRVRNWAPLGMNTMVKLIYSDTKLASLIYKNNPPLAMIPKHPDFMGSHYPVPVHFESPAGRGNY